MKPTTLDVIGDDNELVYQGPIAPILRIGGQKNADETLMFIYFDSSKVTYDDLIEVANNLNLIGTKIDEVLVDDEAYICIWSTIEGGPYEVSFEGNSKFAPFAVKVEFI